MNNCWSLKVMGRILDFHNHTRSVKNFTECFDDDELKRELGVDAIYPLEVDMSENFEKPSEKEIDFWNKLTSYFYNYFHLDRFDPDIHIDIMYIELIENATKPKDYKMNCDSCKGCPAYLESGIIYQCTNNMTDGMPRPDLCRGPESKYEWVWDVKGKAMATFMPIQENEKTNKPCAHCKHCKIVRVPDVPCAYYLCKLFPIYDSIAGFKGYDYCNEHRYCCKSFEYTRWQKFKNKVKNLFKKY